ncbi:MAG: hypothetical protein OXG88_05985 [Gammaproteobacteria bacterium]|nr:hypothetical protein [Gammaproteobacteria bacterium]
MNEKSPTVEGLDPNTIARIIVLQTSLARVIKCLKLTDSVKSELDRIEPVMLESTPTEVRLVHAPNLKEVFQQEVDYFVNMLNLPEPPK